MTYNKTVLLIDDDADLLNAISCRIREELGHDTLIAHDAIAAVDRLTDGPDLVVCDVKMPTTNGLNICEMMDCHEDYQWLPVIVMTGCSDGQTLRRVARLSAHYVVKGPALWPRLGSLIDELLDSAPGCPVDVGASVSDVYGATYYE